MTRIHALAAAFALAALLPAAADAQLPTKQHPNKKAPVAVAARSASPAAKATRTPPPLLVVGQPSAVPSAATAARATTEPATFPAPPARRAATRKP